MTFKATFIIGLVAAALTFGVQTAAARQSSDAVERAKLAASGGYSDAVDRAAAHRTSVGASAIVLHDAHDRGVPPAQYEALTDANQRAALDLGVSPAGPGSGSGTEIDWAPLGIGFGVGMAVMLGLTLAVRFGRGRPLAHS
jgi:hypothetical protein